MEVAWKLPVSDLRNDTPRAHLSLPFRTPTCMNAKLCRNMCPYSIPSSTMKQWPAVWNPTLSSNKLFHVPCITKQRWLLWCTTHFLMNDPVTSWLKWKCIGYRPPVPCCPMFASSSPTIDCGREVWKTMKCPPGKGTQGYRPG